MEALIFGYCCGVLVGLFLKRKRRSMSILKKGGGISMKRFFLFWAVVLLLALPVVAQPTEGPSIDPTTLEAILVIVSGVVVSMVTQVLKKVLGWTGTLARVLDGGIGVVVVAVYFLFLNPPFDVFRFILYALVIFGESSGFYHLVKRTA